jgi:ABC-type glycerol-3-phosphate transport system substrate-binding protein
MSTLRPLSLLACSLLALALAGCPQPGSGPDPGGPDAPADSDASVSARPLTLVVVDDPELGKAIAREWLARTEQELKVIAVGAKEIAGARRLPGDIIVFESGLIGQLAADELIVPLPDELLNKPEFDRRDIFDRVRLAEMNWGHRTFAVPLGSPQLLLAYRPDLFEKLELSVPADWADYQAAAEKLADREALGDLAPPNGLDWNATVEPLADGWAGQTLLARAASASMHREQISPLFEFNTAAALIDKPPYVAALKDLAAAVKTGGFADLNLSPTAAVAEVRAGRAGMAIGWPGTKGALARDGTNEAVEDKEPPVAFALLPGSPRTYNFATGKWEEREADAESRVAMLAVSGRLAAVTSSSANAKGAQGLLVWLAGSEASTAIGPTSAATTLFRRSQQQAAGRWTADLSAAEAGQYAQTLAEGSSLSRMFPGVRISGRAEYLAALDAAVQQVLAEKKSAEEALADAALAWQATTERIGVTAQKRAILRSIGEGEE